MQDSLESQNEQQATSTEQGTQESQDVSPYQFSEDANFPTDPNATVRARPEGLTEEGMSEYTRTRKLDEEDFGDIDPNWGTARFHTRMFLEIKLCGDDGDTGRMSFDYYDAQEIVLGRRDPKMGMNPRINLEAFDALRKGVSRRHAVIARHERGLNLTDLDSANGTFLNGQRLVPNQPRVLRDGDEIRLGRMVLCISFRELEEAPNS